MSYGRLDPSLSPKDGHILRLLVPVRVSDPTKQDERSLGDQRDKIDRWTKERVDHPFEFTVLEGRQSGELLDRAEFQQLIDLVATRNYDAVIAEDLGRIVRRLQAHLFCEHCVDHDTRVIAINDNVDTARSGWQDASIFSAWHHERSNRDTSDRIKRTHRSRFMQGGCLPRELYGYIKPPGAKHDGELTKLPEAEPIYAEWFRMLDEDAASFAEVARWLRAQGVRFPTRTAGVYADPDGKSVARHTFSAILKGVRERNRRKSKRVGSGKYVSVKADPGDLLLRPVPHLAFFEEAYFDRVVAAVRARNARYRRSDDPSTDPLRYRPRRLTRYPGRVTACAVCHRPFVWGGHGQTDHMMCTGARLHRCWNGVTFDGALAARRIAEAVHAEVEQLEDFDDVFLAAVREEAGRLDAGRLRRVDDLRAELAAATAGIANLMKFIRGGDDSPSVREEMRLLERRRACTAAELKAAERPPSDAVRIPETGELRELGRQCVRGLDPSTEEFARVMRRLVRRVDVFPVRLCDGGAIVCRASLTVHLSELLPCPRAREMLQRPLERRLTIDLFEHPQRAAFRERVVAARSAGKSERAVAAELGITVTAAQKASALHRKMEVLGIADPYVAVLQPPDDCPKLRRHRHPEYRFEPLPVTDE